MLKILYKLKVGMDIINEMKKTRSYNKHAKLLNELIKFTSKSKKNEKLILKVADLHLVLAKSIKICSKGMKMEGGVFSGLIQKCFGRLCGIRNGTVDVGNPLTAILNEIQKNLKSLNENDIPIAAKSALVDNTYNLLKDYAIIFFTNIRNNSVQEIDNMELYNTFCIEFSKIAERISREYYNTREKTGATQYQDGKYYNVYPIDLETDLNFENFYYLIYKPCTKYLLCLRHSFEIIIAKDKEDDPNLIAQYTNTFLFYLNKLNGCLKDKRDKGDKRDINEILKEYAANYEEVSHLFPKLDRLKKYKRPDEADEADEIELEFEEP